MIHSFSFYYMKMVCVMVRFQMNVSFINGECHIKIVSYLLQRKYKIEKKKKKENEGQVGLNLNSQAS